MGWLFFTVSLVWASNNPCADQLTGESTARTSDPSTGFELVLERSGEGFVANFSGGDLRDGGRTGGGSSGGARGNGDAGTSGDGPVGGEKAESLNHCISRNVLLFGTSSIANLAGAYSASWPVAWNKDSPWYQASTQWVVEKGKRGIAHPSDYAKAWREDSNFRQNNILNAILMGTLSGVECAYGPAKANAIVTAVALMSSVAGQVMAKGEVSLSQTVLDVAFVRFASLPRVRLGRFVDKRYFQGHTPVRRLSEVSAYYSFDQYIGGFGYGILANLTQWGWPDAFNLKIDEKDLAPLGGAMQLADEQPRTR